jgi:hypothetical protein
MTKTTMILSLTLAAAGAAALAQSGTTMNDVAYVRVVHASPDAPNVDVFLDGKQTVNDAAFKAVTAYGDVPAGKHHVTVTAHGDKKAVVFDNDLTLKAGTYYTVAATNTLKNIKFEVYATTSLNTMKSQARVNVYHLSPGAPNVDALGVDLNNAKVVDNLAFGKMVTKYVSPMGVNLNIVPAGKMEPVVKNISGISIAAGKSYSIFAVGVVGGMGAQAFDTVVTEDKVVMGSMKGM